MMQRDGEDRGAYNGLAGAAICDFDGNRWLVSSGPTGTYPFRGLDIEPSVREPIRSRRCRAITSSSAAVLAAAPN